MAATRLEVSVALRVTNAGALINALARPISYTWYVFYRLLLYLVYSSDELFIMKHENQHATAAVQQQLLVAGARKGTKLDGRITINTSVSYILRR